MNMLIAKPVKKHAYYYSRVTRTDKRAIKLSIPFAVLQHCQRLANKQGYLADFRVPIDDYAMETIREMEAECLRVMLKENKDWFANALDDETIHSMLKSCISGEDGLRIYASVIRSLGRLGEAERAERVDIADWMVSVKKTLPIDVSFTIVCDGMFVYPKFFGLRWIIGEIGVYKEPEDISPDIGEILDFWKEKAMVSLEELKNTKDAHAEIIKTIDIKIDKIKSMNESLNDKNLIELEKEIMSLKPLKNTFP